MAKDKPDHRMNDLNELINSELRRDSADGLWYLEAGETIGYSDGRLNERYLSKVIRDAQDLSSNSTELKGKIWNWVSEYHLSPKRTQLLNAFRFDRDIRYVLEIGAGCGAITRFLGEALPQALVVAVEGSSARASIARVRTRDLNNVEIVAAPFQNLDFKDRFDLAICVGVLEYSPLYIQGEDPFMSALGIFFHALNHEGELVLAIENQFGLKYFAGHREDHTGLSYEGIEGYPRTGGNAGRTFGPNKLSEMLMRAGFKKVRRYFPFPDYKLPEALASEEALRYGRNLGPLLSRYKGKSYRDPLKKTIFEEELAWLELGENHLIQDFANSLLFIAGKGEEEDRVYADWDAVVFSTDRRKEYQTKTLVYGIRGEKPFVNKVKIFEEKPAADCKLDMDLGGTSRDWVEGITFSQRVKKVILDKRSSLYSLLSILEEWRDFLMELCQGGEDGLSNGKFIDAMPQNILCVDGGGLKLIDHEWVWREPVEFRTLIIRGLYGILRDNWAALRKKSYFGKGSMKGLLSYLCSQLAGSCDHEDIREFIKFEAELQHLAVGANQTVSRLQLYIDIYLNDYLKRAVKMMRKIYKKLHGYF